LNPLEAPEIPGTASLRAGVAAREEPASADGALSSGGHGVQEDGTVGGNGAGEAAGEEIAERESFGREEEVADLTGLRAREGSD